MCRFCLAELEQFEPHQTDHTRPETERHIPGSKRGEVKQTLGRWDEKHERQERLARMMTSTDTTSARKVKARAASGCRLERENRNTPRHAARALSPCSTAHPTVANENSRSLALRGGRFITLASASSASKMSEQEGSMISSRKTICTGNSSNGQPEKKTGSMERPAIGT